MLHIGNAIDVGRDYRGWFLGSFMGPSVPALYSTEVEVKWGIHAAGDCRTEWGRADCTSVTVCIRGRFRLLFAEPTCEHVLCKEGDFALWGPGVLHKWTAEEDTVIAVAQCRVGSQHPRPLGPTLWGPPCGARGQRGRGGAETSGLVHGVLHGAQRPHPAVFSCGAEVGCAALGRVPH